MKKIFLLTLSLTLLFSCGKDTELNQAKQELLGNNTEINSPEDEKNEDGINDVTEVGTDSDKPQYSSEGIRIYTPNENPLSSSLSSTPLLNFNPFTLEDITAGEIEITGEADSSVDKIIVQFENQDSDFPDDSYKLQTYSGKGGKFRYVASSKNQVLDFGKNIYEFRAYTGDEFQSSFVEIMYPEKSEESENVQVGSESTLIGTEENILSMNLPTSSKYGEPIMLGESGFTYSQIKGLEVQKRIIKDLSCETVTDYLKENLAGWFYWNTCRDVVKDKGIRFNVVRLDGDEYIYERHYVDFKHGLYGTLELERGTGVNSETISEKNTELKENSYELADVVDGLIRDIIQS